MLNLISPVRIKSFNQRCVPTTDESMDESKELEGKAAREAT